MTIPAEAIAREPVFDGYAVLAPVYIAQGWASVLPLPRGEKWPPPKRYTGHGAMIPTPEQIEEWCTSKSDGNPALYLIDGTVCVDIDNYAKGDRPAGRALEVIAEVQGRAGVSFPATWVLRNRTDGSEKRLYRVPEGLTWRSKLGAGVDLVHHQHRYVNVGVNPDTQCPEQWFSPDGLRSVDPPSPGQLAELPPELVAELARETNGIEIRGLATEAQARRLLESLPGGVMAVGVRDLMTRALEDLAGLNGSRHDATLSHVRDLVKFGAAGLAGADVALAALRADFVAALGNDSHRGSAEVADAEFDRMELNAGQKAAALTAEELALFGSALKALEPGGLWHPDTLWADGDDTDYAVFRVLGPGEWAASVPDTEFLIAKVLCRDTFGVNAGPKKSLKTHDNQAMALAVATGTSLYRCDEFPVRRQGQVLYIVGEGGQQPVQRTLHRMARAYGLNPSEIQQDPDFPLVAAFGAAPIDGEAFRDDLKRLLDTYQPELVLIESFYNFHPRDVQAGDLYQRGQIIDAYHKFVRTETVGTVSILTDHYRSTGTGRSLDLDSISMAGQAENADSWITRYHHKPPEVEEGEFHLRIGFNSRQWGGTEWNVDWHLGQFNHEVGHHVGQICWDIASAVGKKADAPSGNSPAERQALILSYIDANPTTSKSAAIEVLAKRHGTHEKNFRVDWEELISANLLIQDPSGQVPRTYGEITRMVKAKVWKRCNAKIRMRDQTTAGDDDE